MSKILKLIRESSGISHVSSRPSRLSRKCSISTMVPGGTTGSVCTTTSLLSVELGARVLHNGSVRVSSRLMDLELGNVISEL
ncbi:unnamed protein product [Brugia timori]|uniref:Uncharacterized protein n=1 Tax=Brugia timori TaxID=42155 RepID=A0A0R3R106_9BILA|nr:unnamed protein product [Brugia timori]